MGVIGGIDNSVVDSGEYLDFIADGSNEFSPFSLYSNILGNVDGGGIDSYTVEAFNTAGTSLGSFNLQGSGTFLHAYEWVVQLGISSADRFRVTGIDAYRATSITVDFAETGAIPEPATLALFGLGLAGAGVARWRKRKA